jgi:hypothetical protein
MPANMAFGAVLGGFVMRAPINQAVWWGTLIMVAAPTAIGFGMDTRCLPTHGTVRGYFGDHDSDRRRNGLANELPERNRISGNPISICLWLASADCLFRY